MPAKKTPLVKKKAIVKFFRDYEARFNRSLEDPPQVDSEGMRESFADYFVAASPAGVVGGKNGLKFRFALPRGFAFYRKIGTRSMKISALDVLPLDALHAMATVAWDSRYRRDDGKKVRIEFTNRYFLQLQDGEPKIFAYITGDEQKVLKENGLI